MTMPPFLLGAGLAFWGWQSGNLLAATVLALLVEAPRQFSLRFELRPADYSRIADLSTVGFVALAALLSANRGISHGILAAFLWLPAAFAPVLLSQIFGSSGRIPLSALFRYLRKLRQRDPTITDPQVDLSGVYLGVCIISAGVANVRAPGYFIGLVALAAWALASIRPRHASLATWLALLSLATGLGYAGQFGLNRLQGALEEWVGEWQMRGMNTQPYRSTTDIGSIGKLKLLDAIVLRVYAPARDAARLKLLHRASFTTYAGTTWIARNAPLGDLSPQQDGARWIIDAAPADRSVRIATRLEGGRALLALPSATAMIAELPALALRANALGAVQAEMGGGDWARYVAHYASDAIRKSAGYVPPRAEDTALPKAEAAAFEKLATRLALHGLSAQEALGRVKAHFLEYSYSTYRESAAPSGTTPLADFIQRSRSGHCEYFAAAATLLLRAAGVPARYATGFAMLEYSPLEGAFVVRARHAHAWTRVWLDGRWIDLDTTPPVWFTEEARSAPLWQGLSDFARWALYRWSQRGEFEGGIGWYLFAAVLAVVLAWRLLRGKRAARAAQPAASLNEREYPGLDSAFYAAERNLAARVAPRDESEALSIWARRIGADLEGAAREQLNEALALHLRHRFDPDGLQDPERSRLATLCERLSSEPTGVLAPRVHTD